MHPVKGIYFSFLVTVVVALSPEEAIENWKKERSKIIGGYHITYNTTKNDENFINTIKAVPRVAFSKASPETPEIPQMPKEPQRRTRKEYRCLKRDERNFLHQAINNMKYTTLDQYTLSAYDLIVRSHNADMAPKAHYSQSFLPWHRHYVK